MYDCAMVMTVARADKYRFASRDIPNKHGYTVLLVKAHFLHRSIGGYEKCGLFSAERRFK